MTSTGVAPALPPQVSPPGFSFSDRPPYAVPGADVVALPVLPALDEGGSPLLGPGAAELSDLLDVDPLALLEAGRAVGKPGEVTTLPVPQGIPGNADLRWVLLVGVGDRTPGDFRRAGAALARAARDAALVATTIPTLADDDGLEAFVVGAMLGSFIFHWRSAPPEHQPLARLVVVATGDDERRRTALARAVTLGTASWRARTMASVPSNVKNPEWLAEQARLVAGQAGLEVRVWDEGQLAAEGFGGIVGVGQASATPPRLIRLDYTPRPTADGAGAGAPTVVLVGKGITFDTGGLSIKPGEAMVTMKRDMTGGAVVIATMAALDAVDCPVRVVGLVAAAENAVGGNALRPGDVVRHYGGRTSEVTNTDAEGRLVLADALAYAVDALEPAAVVDVATLTGAMKVALGQGVGGYFANHEALAASIAHAGEAAGEPLWRFPLAGAYEEKLSSTVADADNAPSGPGAIIAALFLQHFVGDVPWAHLDVASVGDAPDESHEFTTGPTGFGARVLLRWLAGPDPLAGVR